MSAFAASLGLAAAVAQHGLTGHEPFVGAPLLGAAVLLRPCASLSILTALRSRGPGLPFRCRFLRCHSFVRPALTRRDAGAFPVVSGVSTRRPSGARSRSTG